MHDLPSYMILYILPGFNVTLAPPPPGISVTDGPSGVAVKVGVVVTLQPVVIVTVWVGMTQPVGQVRQVVATVWVPVLGQQALEQGTLEVAMEMYMGHITPGRSGQESSLGQAAGRGG